MQNINRQFGDVRRPNVGVRDIGGVEQGFVGAYGSYAMASGTTQANLEDVRKELKVLQDERVVLNGKVASATQAVIKNNELAKKGNAGWTSCKNSDCKGHHSASRCGNCRKPFQTMIDTANSNKTLLASAVKSAVDNLKAKDSQIAQAGDTIASLLESIAAENQAEQTLADSGTSSEEIAINAKADADAIIIAAQTEAETKASGKKTRNLIIALTVVAAVAIGVVFMIKKIRKKK